MADGDPLEVLWAAAQRNAAVFCSGPVPRTVSLCCPADPDDATLLDDYGRPRPAAPKRRASLVEWMDGFDRAPQDITLLDEYDRPVSGRLVSVARARATCGRASPDVQWMQPIDRGCRTPNEALLLSRIGGDRAAPGLVLQRGPGAQAEGVEWMKLHRRGSWTPAEAHMLSSIRQDDSVSSGALGVWRDTASCHSRSWAGTVPYRPTVPAHGTLPPGGGGAWVRRQTEFVDLKSVSNFGPLK